PPFAQALPSRRPPCARDHCGARRHAERARDGRGGPTIRRSALLATAVLIVLGPAARATTCPRVCQLFQEICLEAPRKLRLCRAGCAFDRRPGSCRQTCRETAHELAH